MSDVKRELQHLNDASRLLDAMRAWYPSIVCHGATAQTDAEHDRHLLAKALAAAELAGKEAAEALATQAFTALGRWEQRTNAGSVCIPQPMHDGTLRMYAGVTGCTPSVAQGADATAVALSLCKTLGLELIQPPPSKPEGG